MKDGNKTRQTVATMLEELKETLLEELEKAKRGKKRRGKRT